MIDGRDEVLGSAEAERAMADGLDLVVHALDGSVREADLGPGKNSIQVGAQHLCEFLERLQLGAHGPSSSTCADAVRRARAACTPRTVGRLPSDTRRAPAACSSEPT